ncbi:hypothetical protein RLDS_19425 [Sphingobium lactosutens DS20]|uniref:Uncharacterized protein n=1 Tax=Sphingobium lactosutens DS20 TaxID=1331060 RepID=T0H7R2_9SPHN|nr:hypothetical protein RLDS_19425 [Sphingobium lactosutens DS20]
MVLRKLYIIKDKDLDGNPVERTVTDAHFKIAVEGNEIVNLSLGDGITWDGITQSLSLVLKNSDLSDITSSTDGDYQYYITLETGRIITLFAGRAYMERSL